MKAHLVKTEQGFIPADDRDKEQTDKIGLGEIIEAEFRKDRNYKFHKKYMAMLEYVLQTQDKITDMKQLLRHIKLGIGHFNQYMIDDKVITELDSISFRRMDEFEFQDIYSRTADYILETFCPEQDRDEWARILVGFL